MPAIGIGIGPAFNRGGVVAVTIIAPSALSVQYLTSTSVRCSWTINSLNHVGCKVYISTDNVTFTLTATVTGSTATADIADLIENQSYYYKVTAYKGQFESPYSETILFGQGLDLSSYSSSIDVQIDQNRKLVASDAESNGVLVIGSDDGTPSDYSVIYNYLNSKGLKGSSALIASTLNTGSGISTANALSMLENGYDLWYHSYRTVNDLESLTDEQLREDIEAGIAIFSAEGITFEHHVPPFFTSFIERYRAIAQEYFKGLRNVVYNHNMTWDKTRKIAIGALTCWLFDQGDYTGAEYLQQGKDYIDYAKKNKSIFCLYTHQLTGDAVSKFQELVDYAIASGIEITTWTDLYNRIERNQGKWIPIINSNKYQAINYEDHELPAGKVGRVILNTNLADSAALVAAAEGANYQVLFLNDTSDGAHAYACQDSGFRAKLRALTTPITSMRKMQQRESLLDLTAFTGTFANFGIEHFIGLTRIYLHDCTITGSIPRQIKYADKLWQITLSNCTLSGSIPIEISHLFDLQIFDCGNVAILGNSNALTDYESGAFSIHQLRLNKIVLTDNRLPASAINQILKDVRDSVKENKGWKGMYAPATQYHQLYLAGRYNAEPTGSIDDPTTGKGAKYQLENAISELGAANNWTVLTNTAGTGSITTSGTLSIWVDADNGITTSSGEVTEWLDKSSNFNHLREPLLSAYPTYVENQINGLPVVRGLADTVNRIKFGDAVTFSRNGSTLFFVMKLNELDATERAIAGNSAASNPNRICFSNASTSTLRILGASQSYWCNKANAGLGTSSYFILEIHADSGTVNTYINGSLLATGTPTDDLVLNQFFCRGTTNSIKADLASAVLYTNSLSLEQRNTVRNALQSKYGL